MNAPYLTEQNLTEQDRDEQVDNLLQVVHTDSQELQASATSSVESHSTQNHIEGLLAEIDPTDFEIVERYFGLDGNEPQSPDQISADLGLSVADIASRLTKGLRHLRSIDQESPLLV
jgi:DNA-directed RNA polymerase sigma subunit (sigma70/sigma32)